MDTSDDNPCTKRGFNIIYIIRTAPHQLILINQLSSINFRGLQIACNCCDAASILWNISLYLGELACRIGSTSHSEIR